MRTSKKRERERGRERERERKGAAHGAETPHGVPSVCEGTDTDEPVSKRRLLSFLM